MDSNSRLAAPWTAQEVMREALVTSAIDSAVEARGDAIVALATGPTGAAIAAGLAKSACDWSKVTLVPTDGLELYDHVDHSIELDLAMINLDNGAN